MTTFFYLYGDKDLVLQKLKNLKFLKSNYELIDTKIIVSNELSPIAALKKGKGSSMWESIQSQISLNTDVSLSAGNTGVFFSHVKNDFKNVRRYRQTCFSWSLAN